MTPADAQGRMRIEVVYALPDRQELIAVDLPSGAILSDAVMASGLQQKYPDIEAGVTPAGIFGKRADWDAALEDGDRVELYRALIADPKEQRRRRVRR